MMFIKNNQGGGFVKENEYEEDGLNWNDNIPLSQELDTLYNNFRLLSELKETSLLQILMSTMEDTCALSELEDVLDRLGDGETALKDLEESERKTLQDIEKEITDIADVDEETQSSLFSAIHLIVSAINEMTENSISDLASCCSPQVLKALENLVQQVAAESPSCLSLDIPGLAVLRDTEVYEPVNRLFGQSNITLKREGDTLTMEITDTPGFLPLVLGIAVKGLASLAA